MILTAAANTDEASVARRRTDTGLRHRGWGPSLYRTDVT